MRIQETMKRVRQKQMTFIVWHANTEDKTRRDILHSVKSKLLEQYKVVDKSKMVYKRGSHSIYEWKKVVDVNLNKRPRTLSIRQPALEL